MNKVSGFVIFILLVLPVLSIFAQSKKSVAEDTVKINQLIEQAAHYTNRDPSLSIKYAEKVVEKSRSVSFERLKGLYYIGYAHYIKNNYDSAVVFLE